MAEKEKKKDDDDDEEEEEDDEEEEDKRRKTCGRGHSYQARPLGGGWGIPWNHAGSRVAPNIVNKEPWTKPTAGTRRGFSPSAVRCARQGVGERRRDLPSGKVPVATPIATEGDGLRNPRTLYKQEICEGTLGVRTAVQHWSGIVRRSGAPRTVVQHVGPVRGATPRQGPIGRKGKERMMMMTMMMMVIYP